jgi:hypothetical protein
MPAYAAQKAQSPKYHPQNLPVMTGSEEFHGPVAYPPYFELPGLDEVDLIGDTITVGMTWYENQHYGTIGRMVEKGSDGYLHFVWTKGYQASGVDRHVWYNSITPAGSKVFLDGIVMDYSYRAGFAVVDADYGGIAFPAFHQVTNDPSGNPHTAAAFDIAPHLGAFTAFEVPWLYDPYGSPREIIWPRMQMDSQQRLHILSTEYQVVAGDPQMQYYTPGQYDPLSYLITYPQPPDSSFRTVAWTMTLAGEVATSDVSDRIAFGWTYCRDEGFPGGNPSQLNNDIHLLIDDDGRAPDFSQAFNLTNFIPPDPAFLPDTLLAQMDTLRAYCDLNLFFDQDDWLHAAFTTRSYFQFEETSYWHTSIIWHWTEQYPDSFQMIHNAFDDWWVGWYPGGQSGFSNVYCGAWNLKAQRPSLGQDTTTGYLYCMYQVYDCDTTHLSAFIGQSGWGMPSGEVYISVSTDGGMNWSVGTNVTSTITPNHAPPGQCKSEITPSLAKLVDAYCHILYVYDLDAGNCIQMEGSATNNPVRYHRVPVNLIPTAPLVPQNVPFHVEHYTEWVNLQLTPSGLPITIPSSGGSFNYAISGQNNSSMPQTRDAWCKVRLPSGIWHGPVWGPVAVTIPAGTTVSHDHVQYVPGWAAPGSYLYRAYMGEYPFSVADQDSFAFTKLPGEGRSLVDDWFLVCRGCQEGETPGNLPAPAKFAIKASPNPFNPTVALRFDLPVASRVKLGVYDISGRLVSELVNGWREAGLHEVAFDGSNLASGIYLYRLQAGAFAASGKMVLIK